VHGDGDVYHLGGGLAGRLDFELGRTGSPAAAQPGEAGFTPAEAMAGAAQDARPSVIYVEASFRAGGAHNEYDSSDLRDPSGRKADYDASSAYYGFHLGAGYLWKITEAASLDLYGKYFWTRLQGDSVTLSTGDPVKFESTDSSRLRLGGRFAWAVNEHVSPYIGAAWEHEFEGRARATAHGFDIDAPSLSGDTGIGELGLTLTPSASLPLYFDLGVQGYTGKREGVTGSLQARFEF
jgi:outer membrane autotransporter protein